MNIFLLGLLGGFLVATFIFVLGIPPFSDVAGHFFAMTHPVARQLKVARTLSEASTLYTLSAAIDLGLFDILKNNDSPMTIDEIAAKMEVPTRGVKAMVDALCAADYLYSMGDGRYTNSQTSLHHLTSGIEYDKDMKSLVSLFGSRFLSEMRVTSAAAIRNGGGVHSSLAEDYDHPFWKHFSAVSGSMAKQNAVTMTSNSNLAAAVRGAVLDVASGSGEYGFAALSMPAVSSVTFLDYPNVLDQLKSNAMKKAVNMTNAKFIAGSFFDIESDGVKFDTIVASNILHHFSVDTSVRFLEIAHSLLAKDGNIVILDMCPPDSPYSIWEGHSLPRSFSMTMLTWTKHGKAYSVSELNEMLVKTGFNSGRHTSSFPFSTFIVAQKQ